MLVTCRVTGGVTGGVLFYLGGFQERHAFGCKAIFLQAAVGFVWDGHFYESGDKGWLDVCFAQTATAPQAKGFSDGFIAKRAVFR